MTKKIVPTKSVTTKTTVVKTTKKLPFGETGDLKEEARRIMVNTIKNSSVKTKILSLPASECYIERLLYKEVSRKIDYVFCERDKTTFWEMVQTASIAFTNHPPTFVNKSIGTVLMDSRKDEFSHLILDYCGTIGSVNQELEYVLKNDIIQVGGSICLTFCKRIPLGEPMDFVRKMEQLNPQSGNSEETRTEHALRTFINRNGGYRYSIDRVFNYRDVIFDEDMKKTQKQPMLLMIVKRIE